MTSILEQISLCTFSTGRTMVREVLGDWLHFLGGRPNQVIFAVSPRTGPPPVYEELHKAGLIDHLLYLEAAGRSLGEVDAEAIRLIVEAATTEWVLLFKLDTLPYRSGQENWLHEAMERVVKFDLFGMTGSAMIADLVPLEVGYSTTQKFSNNFSIFRRTDWLSATRSAVGDDRDPGRAGGDLFEGNNLRFINEYLIEAHMRKTGRRMLVKHETREWSVFHVNVWGEALARVRGSYLQRRRVKPFLNTGKAPRRPIRYPWQEYYGYPRPRLFKLMRIVLGRWRRNLMGHNH